MGSAVKKNTVSPAEAKITSRISTTPRMHEKSVFLYVLSGRCEILLENETVNLRSGDAIYIDRYAVYAGVNFSEDLKMISLKLSVHESVNLSEKVGLYKRFSLGEVTQGEKIKDYVYDSFKTFSHGGEVSNDFYIKGIAYMLIGTLLSGDSEVETKIEQSAMERVSPVIDYIKEHYKEEISVEKAASILNLNPSYFCRLFKSATGKTFIHYINGYRIMIAQRELSRNGATVTQLVYEMGFSSYSYFNRIFKQFSGCSPTEYQKKFGTNTKQKG